MTLLMLKEIVAAREYGRANQLRSPRDTLYSQNLALTFPTSGGVSVGIVLSRTKPTEFSFNFFYRCVIRDAIYVVLNNVQIAGLFRYTGNNAKRH
jgi:hypothetical protein